MPMLQSLCLGRNNSNSNKIDKIWINNSRNITFLGPGWRIPSWCESGNLRLRSPLHGQTPITLPMQEPAGWKHSSRPERQWLERLRPGQQAYTNGLANKLQWAEGQGQSPMSNANLITSNVINSASNIFTPPNSNDDYFNNMSKQAFQY